MKTVLLFSGGVDSTTILAQLVGDGNEVVCLSVDYGQRHFAELDAARVIARSYGVEHVLTSLPVELFRSPLTSNAPLPRSSGRVSAAYVPFRNGTLISLGVALAQARGADAVYFGGNRDDWDSDHAFPDCSYWFVEAMQKVVEAATGGEVELVAPLVYNTKAEVLSLATELGVPLDLTVTCYNGLNPGCGECEACLTLTRAREEQRVNH